VMRFASDTGSVASPRTAHSTAAAIHAGSPAGRSLARIVLMLASGGLFVLVQWRDWTSLGGHLVLAIEAVEILLFVIFWAFQTVERWNKTV
jgi:hypothetical protein